MKSNRLRVWVGAALTPLVLASPGILAAPGGGGGGGGNGGGGGSGQASITLNASGAAVCNKTETVWTVDKKASDADGNPVTQVTTGGAVTWKIDVTKGPADVSDVTGTAGPTADSFCIVGNVSVTNSGTATASIGNFVVNVQKKVGNKWVSAAADMANRTSRENATSANIVAAASQEVAPNGVDYTAVTSGAFKGEGTFTKYRGGKLYILKDDNDLWAINPGLNIPTCAADAVNCTVNFDFEAFFDPALGAELAGQQVRVEIIATFGNSGLRGGSGSSLTTDGIDIDGSGGISNDEKNIRSVPSRITLTIPAREICNAQASLTDVFTTDGVTSDPADPGVAMGLPATVGTAGSAAAESISFSATTTLTLTDPGVEGSATNTATITDLGALRGSDCCDSFSKSDPVTVVVVPEQCETCGQCPPGNPACMPQCGNENQDPCPADFCSYTQGGWGAKPVGGNPSNILVANPGWFPLRAGIYPGSFNMEFWGQPNVQAYLPAGGDAGALDSNLVNPSGDDASAAGVFGGQVLALNINLLYKSGLGSLYYQGTLVSTIAATMNTVLGGGGDASQIAALNTLATNLNESFDNCKMSNWAWNNLSTTP